MNKLLIIPKTGHRHTRLAKLALFIITILSIINSGALLGAEDSNSYTTPISLVLVGTIASKNSSPLALIQLENEKLHFYSQGDKVGSYIVTKIQRNSIQLTHNAQIYTLHLQHKLSLADTQDVSNTRFETELPQQIPIQRQLLDHIRTNIQQWLNAVSLKLEITDGRVSGYIIEAIYKLPLQVSIGLKQGDVIKSINGIHVSQAQLFTQTVDKLIDNSDIDIQIERGHKTNTLNFHISE